MIPDEARFLWDIESLQEISRYPNAKSLVDASVILRRLLLDKECLLHKISRKLRVKPRFRVFPDASKESFTDILENLPVKDGLVHFYINPDPSIYPNFNQEEVGLDQFLASAINFTGGEVATVRDIINYVANVGGGVHQGRPQTRDAQIIHENANKFWINGVPYPLENLRNVINITINGLLPLYWRIKS